MGLLTKSVLDAAFLVLSARNALHVFSPPWPLEEAATSESWGHPKPEK